MDTRPSSALRGILRHTGIMRTTPSATRIPSGVLGLLFVAGLLVGGAMPVRAASTVSFEDPAGDQLDPRPSMDILKASWSVTQATSAGRPRFVVEIELAAPPEPRLVNYSASGDAGGGCYFEVGYHPGTVFSTTGIEPTADFYGACPHWEEYEMRPTEARLEITGSVITMSLPVDALHPDVGRSGAFTGLRATSEIAEPVTGVAGTWVGGAGADEATTGQTFRYA